MDTNRARSGATGELLPVCVCEATKSESEGEREAAAINGRPTERDKPAGEETVPSSAVTEAVVRLATKAGTSPFE